MSLILHDYELDADAYKVRLLLSVLGVAYEKVPVNVHPGREQRSPAYRRLNPLGALPILVDGDLVLYEAEAILAYVALRHDPVETWLPQQAAAFAAVTQWLIFAARELAAATAARLHHMLEAPGDPIALDKAARAAFRIMEDHLTKRELAGAKWFVGDEPTLADLALFPSIALSRDFGIDHDEYPALRRWMRRVRAIPGFVTMPGIPDYH
ncbi:glutathione S-transferase family protein [Kaistia algarum]|uniref:glutathione S-transferase family protein n=1 Tax=Kaistia algarum TaxID=2083279 RepID=UPI000CE8D6F6|nr:glutathione S-transferase family protein [Kaistia algarum]MCX5516546.1 glutathione S-transferase family protein [Kaistia algarum]PPE78342.1 glutathione S-transferase family protein [Kaistia algarum]